MMTRRRRKPRRTQLERRNETQAAILSAAVGLLAEHGYAGFSASRVAARAGVSRGAQEHYFPDSAALASEVGTSRLNRVHLPAVGKLHEICQLKSSERTDCNLNASMLK